MPHYILDTRTATPHFPGIGRYVTNLARGLAPLLARDERLTLFYDPAHPPSVSPTGIAQLVPVATSPFSLQQQWVIPRLLRQIAGGAPAIYHSAYILMPYAPGVPTVLTVYDLIPLLLPGQSSGRARLLARTANALALRAARRVLAISAATRADYIRHMGVLPERIMTVPLAADPVFRPQAPAVVAALRSRLYLPERYVLYLGSNKPHKNLVRLVEAWGRANCRLQTACPVVPGIADCRLVIAGAWDDRFPDAQQRAEVLGLADCIRFLGPVAEADLPALYAGAALFVFPSLYEGFGMPVLEAMACGTPVICANGSSLPEVVGDPSAGSGQAAAIQVDPLDVDALAATIGRVLGDEALAEELRGRGLRQAARFTWTQTAQQTLAVYRSQMAGPAQTH
ncbi:MAG: hypothetical protein AUK03_11895 [Anaerolineae bacterium CG2_30_64_16]|nr:MAG: hypothetical protein AUK03_11895 [Anaerolineae bacterium CG2_30_64_16]